MLFRVNHNLVNADSLTIKQLLDENTPFKDMCGIWYLQVPPGDKAVNHI